MKTHPHNLSMAELTKLGADAADEAARLAKRKGVVLTGRSPLVWGEENSNHGRTSPDKNEVISQKVAS